MQKIVTDIRLELKKRFQVQAIVHERFNSHLMGPDNLIFLLD